MFDVLPWPVTVPKRSKVNRRVFAHINHSADLDTFGDQVCPSSVTVVIVGEHSHLTVRTTAQRLA